MSDIYTLTLHNQSTDPQWTFAVYTVNPISESSTQLPIAWLTKTLNSGNSVTFEWSLNYQVMFATQGIQSDVQWTESAYQDVDDNSAENAAELGYSQGDYTFELEPGKHSIKPGEVYIDTAGNVPNYSPDTGPSVGLAIIGGVQDVEQSFVPAIAGASGPNLAHTFDLHPTYYIDAGTAEQGVMVDLTTRTKKAEIEFQPGEFSQEWTLTKDNNWVRNKKPALT
ncbi:hypothetical protein AGRA3207_003737 [Actinomadura graeca]|uniref:Uncharacterized protein n=1 Tax=Actinomadura graeca TaxID=2750812 RepID=A0ABX8QWI7_9ACTN|nr:hypothetical protein [Actinomadura graeca]QXJ22691.1 hypothetical protein AGRA3207_003737 [Actinomadura graeca]